MRVALFVSCLVDQMWPAAGVATVEVLRRAGCEVDFDPRQTCCGQPAFNTGYRDEARRVARQFLDVMGDSDAEAIVIPSGSCCAMVHRLPKLFESGADADRARELAARTHELASFLVHVLGVESVGGHFDGKVTFHDACHGLRDLGVRDEPRRLIRGVRGVELVELPRSEACCGFGGSFSVKHPELSVAMLDRRLEGLDELGVDALVSGDVSCLMQIEGRVQRLAKSGSFPVVPAMHLAELLVVDGALPLMAHQSPEFFADNVGRALADGELRGALRRATDLFSERRRAALDKMPDWEELRTRARQIKDETLADLDRHLDSFVANAEAAGVRIHRASDAEGARRIVGDIASQAETTEAIVKAKSMTTEEIELNEYLEARGLHALETDLGEWIIQLAEERPSHIIVPAIHKTRAQIAALFAKHLETDPELDAEAMTAVAREFLRERFAAADVGISGVNFAVAETGSILLLENEGNIRLTTTLPRVHIALMGIEKVVPRFADLAVFLRLLPRSGTGQHLTSYQSILTGPKRRPEDEGPEEMHIVLLDNGRSRMLESPVTRQSLACIRCGACLNACPVYQQIGGHAYGSVYPGPIGAIITPQLNGGENAAALPFASSLCGACLEVCPVKIDIPELLLHLRAEGRGRGSRLERLAFGVWSRVSSSRRGFEWGGAALRLLARIGLLRALPPVRAWRRQRELRPLAARPFRSLWASGLAQADRAQVGRVVAPADGPAEPAARPTETATPVGDALGRFRGMVLSVGGHCHVADDLRDALSRLLEELGVSTFVCSDAEILREFSPEGRTRLEARAPRSDVLAADAGISTAQWGIAETGTLVLTSDQERHRLASLLPPVHVAVLSRARIVETLDDALERVGRENPAEISRAVTFITGPSRTADIELTLVVGVHGPGALHVIVIP